jgi:hypothetical protein
MKIISISTAGIIIPSNSYLYLYGDMDMNERLDWIDRAYLSHFDTLTVDSEVAKEAPVRPTGGRTPGLFRHGG